MPEPDHPEAGPGLDLADRATFTAIFRRFYAPLARYARRLTGDSAATEDVLQDVFVRLWEKRETLTVEVSLQALLYTMVRNRALKLRRRARWFAADVSAEDVLALRPVAPTGGQAVDADILRRRLYRWIDDLPTRRREAFVLSRYHGLTHREIAGVMGVSERTVDTHILLALRELRSRLDDFQTENLSP